MTTFQLSPKADTGIHRQLRGVWLWGARLTWVTLVGLTVYFFLLIIPTYVQNSARIVGDVNPFDIGRLSLDFYDVIRQFGVTTGLYARFITGVYVFTSGISFLLGIYIAFRGSDDWLILLSSLFIIAFGITFPALINSANIAVPRAQYMIPGLATTIVILAFIGFMAFFPDGRFVPKWLIPLATLNILLAVILLAQWFTLSRRVVFSNLSFFFTWRQQASLSGGLVVAYFVQLVGFGALAQAWRYFRYASHVQRQQAKWLTLGIAFVLVTFILFIAPPLILGNQFPPVIKNVGDILFLISLISIPITLGFSVLRYRVWDVDFVINRSLAYGFTSVLLAVVFSFGFVAVRALLHTIIGGEQVLLAAVLPAVAIALMFNPTRKRLRRFIDRRFYGIEIPYSSPAKQAPALSAVLTSVGDYTNLQPIGSGGMGDVYRAVHTQTGQIVAVKMLPANLAHEGQFLRRFEREAQVISALQHPNIVQLVDYGKKLDTAYLIMEYIDGQNVAQLIHDRGKIVVSDALAILNAVAHALDYAHKQGIVHRDVKPSNVMIGMDGRVVLMDFGIARMAGLTQLTASGGMVGTLDYIAPEQIQGAANVDQRADIYSLGVMTYQMLTGERPFKKNNPGALVMAHLMEPPPDACALIHDLPELVCAALQKAMAKKPEDRFVTVLEMVAAMQG